VKVTLIKHANRNIPTPLLFSEICLALLIKLLINFNLYQTCYFVPSTVLNSNFSRLFNDTSNEARILALQLFDLRQIRLRILYNHLSHISHIP